MGLLAYKGLLQVLGDVDDEVAHALQAVQYVYVVDACLVVLRVVFDVLYLGIAEVVTHVVDTVLGIVGIGYLLQCAPVGIHQIIYHGVVGVVHGIHHALEFLDGILVEGLVVHISSGEDAADNLARVAERFQFLDYLVHGLYLLGGVLADITGRDTVQEGGDLVLYAVGDFLVLDELVAVFVELVFLCLPYGCTGIAEAFLGNLCKAVPKFSLMAGSAELGQAAGVVPQLMPGELSDPMQTAAGTQVLLLVARKAPAKAYTADPMMEGMYRNYKSQMQQMEYSFYLQSNCKKYAQSAEAQAVAE